MAVCGAWRASSDRSDVAIPIGVAAAVAVASAPVGGVLAPPPGWASALPAAVVAARDGVGGVAYEPRSMSEPGTMTAARRARVRSP